MVIKTASKEDMLSLWEYNSYREASPTARFFADNIASGNAEFWKIDESGETIGELYVFFDLADKAFADGKTTAYLCAFRIKKEYRGKGLGSRLMEHVLADMRERGFSAATIGVDSTEEQNIRLYHRLGFTEKIKDCFEDPCDVDEDMRPKACECYWLLKKELW
ncbi:MAG: GNAT family N-acetyltransferase [Lachnospiraceae bacterium]|nr:GNAT family N-acetyltransferase [Lachnospiraceae bacterium]